MLESAQYISYYVIRAYIPELIVFLKLILRTVNIILVIKKVHIVKNSVATLYYYLLRFGRNCQ